MSRNGVARPFPSAFSAMPPLRTHTDRGRSRATPGRTRRRSTARVLQPCARSATRLPDRGEQLLDLVRTRRPRVRLRSRALGDGPGELGEVVLRDAEVAQPLEAAEPRQLLHPPRRVVGLERLAE